MELKNSSKSNWRLMIRRQFHILLRSSSKLPVHEVFADYVIQTIKVLNS